MIMAYDKTGVIAKDRVTPGSTVTVSYYKTFCKMFCVQRFAKKCPPCSQPVSSICITRGLMPQVQYRKFSKSIGGKCFPTHHTVLTWAHQTLTCSQNWRNHSLGNDSEALRRCLISDPSNQMHQQRRYPDRNTRLAQTLDRCDKAQRRLHWRPVNVICKINSFFKRKHTVCRTFEITNVFFLPECLHQHLICTALLEEFPPIFCKSCKPFILETKKFKSLCPVANIHSLYKVNSMQQIQWTLYCVPCIIF
jgi:hypothetical protein